MLRVSNHRISRLRQRIYEIFEHGPVGDRTGRNVSRLIVALISINVVVVALESVPDVRARFGTIFNGQGHLPDDRFACGGFSPPAPRFAY